MEKRIMLKLDERGGIGLGEIGEIYKYLEGINKNFTDDDIGEILYYSTYSKDFNYDLRIVSIDDTEIWLEIV